MTPTTPFIPIRTCRPSVAFTAVEHLLHALQACNNFLSKRCENDIRASPMDLDGLRGASGGRCEEIMNVLVVDFEVGAAKEVFSCRGASDITKDIFHSSWDNTRLVFVATLVKF